MIEVSSKKPLLAAIQSGEQAVRVTDPKFLLACMVAQECGNDKNNIKKFLSLIQAKITADDLEYSYGDYNVDPSFLKIGLAQKNGRVKWVDITLSACATALGIMDILESNHSAVKVVRTVDGLLTGEVQIVPC